MSETADESTDEGSGSTLTLATYNIHGALGSDGYLSLRRVGQAIRALDADLIALQEVGAVTIEGQQRSQLSWLAAELGYRAIEGRTLQRGDGPYGNGLLSRRELRLRRLVDLSVPGREPRGAIDAELALGRSRPLRVVATHLGLRRREQRRQQQRLAELLAQERGPLVLLGDLNCIWPLGYGLKRLWPWPRQPAPRTFPACAPLLPLDRVLVQPPAAVRELVAVRGPLFARTSDHLPLRAVIDCAKLG